MSSQYRLLGRGRPALFRASSQVKNGNSETQRAAEVAGHGGEGGASGSATPQGVDGSSSNKKKKKRNRKKNKKKKQEEEAKILEEKQDQLTEIKRKVEEEKAKLLVEQEKKASETQRAAEVAGHGGGGGGASGSATTQGVDGETQRAVEVAGHGGGGEGASGSATPEGVDGETQRAVEVAGHGGGGEGASGSATPQGVDGENEQAGQVAGHGAGRRTSEIHPEGGDTSSGVDGSRKEYEAIQSLLEQQRKEEEEEIQKKERAYQLLLARQGKGPIHQASMGNETQQQPLVLTSVPLQGGDASTPEIHPEEGGSIPEIHQVSKLCIFKVDKDTKLVHDVYTPKLISIGPTHYKNGDLRKESVKKEYARKLFERFGEDTGIDQPKFIGSTVTDFRNYLSIREAEIRGSYAWDTSEITSDELIDIISWDAMFFIEILLKYNEAVKDGNVSALDKFLKSTDSKIELMIDLMLLENQIPLFIHLYLCDRYEIDTKSFLLLLSTFFNIEESLVCRLDENTVRRACHLLDLRRLMETGGKEKKEITTEWVQVDSATTLTKYGVKFRPIRGTGMCSYKFSRSILFFHLLEIPVVHIDECWLSIVLNMIAFETGYCLNFDERPICQFIYLLDCLIQKFEDMQLLMDSKILIVKYSRKDEVYKKLIKINAGKNCNETNDCNMCKVEARTILCSCEPIGQVVPANLVSWAFGLWGINRWTECFSFLRWIGRW
ncbi:hypothetical protein Dsin_026505 [Dipteronia sinensis]|uniref:Uncharacterized protein n=1 Tax=Dipteronia sinensis TaxID=43782 RepID=A0AAE0DXW1_9ROSI|nr:hypothetical protein Dsin_026505 [Dipteronia sinensis]